MELLITSENGCLYQFNSDYDQLRLLFEHKNGAGLMGICCDGKFVYVSSDTQIYKLEIDSGFKCISYTDSVSLWKLTASVRFFARRSPCFHQMDIIDSELFTTATGINEILRFNSNDLALRKRHAIMPPRKFLPIRYKFNYNHINNIFRCKDRYYVTLNWYGSKQYGISGVAVLNDNMQEVDRFEYGWEIHNFCVIDNKKMAICASSGKINKVNHPHSGGLMVDGALVFEHDPDAYFCKDFSVNNELIVMVGGEIRERNKRSRANGVIFVLDRNYKLLWMREFSGTGGFRGCLLNRVDYTKYNSKIGKPLV